MSEQLYNVNVASSELLPTPEEVKRELPASPEAQRCVLTSSGVGSNSLEATLTL